VARVLEHLCALIFRVPSLIYQGILRALHRVRGVQGIRTLNSVGDIRSRQHGRQTAAPHMGGDPSHEQDGEVRGFVETCRYIDGRETIRVLRQERGLDQTMEAQLGDMFRTTRTRGANALHPFTSMGRPLLCPYRLDKCLDTKTSP
jgi:hypothetical protein